MKISRAIIFLTVLVLIFGIGIITVSLHAQVGRGKKRLRGKVVSKDNEPIAIFDDDDNDDDDDDDSFCDGDDLFSICLH